MRITDQQLARFNDMVANFAKRNGLTAETETQSLSMDRTDVCLSNGKRFKRYVVIWYEVPSLTDAGAQIFSDALNFFGLTKDDTCVSQFEIKDVIFNNPATIVLWADGTETVVKCQDGDLYSEEVGLALCFAKKALGNKSNFNNVFHKWIPEEEPVAITVPKMNPNDAMVAQAAIEQLNASKPRSAADILADLLGNRRGYMRGV